MKALSEGVLFFALSLVVLCFPVQAQQPKKIPRIGVLVTSSPSPTSQRIEAFRRGLRELGYLEGEDILIEYRYGESLRKWMSSSRAAHHQPRPLKTQLQISL